MRVHIFNKVEIMNLKEWGAHGRSWRGWERNDTNSVPIKFSKIKKKCIYRQHLADGDVGLGKGFWL